MASFNNLPEDVNDYIYQHHHKLCTRNLHNQLENSFEGLYKLNLIEFKYGEIEDIIGSHHAQAWMDTVVPQIEDEINDQHYYSKKLSNILSFQQINYLKNVYDLDGDKYGLEDWWDNNNGIDQDYQEFQEYEGV